MGSRSEGEEIQEQWSSGGEEKIFVSVRLRPLNEKEKARNKISDWECINNDTIVFKNSLPERSMFPTAYTFDRVFGCECDTRQVYLEGAKQIALSVLDGINATVFAYGQTSSGKTYTMRGITEYAVADIYDYLERHEEREFLVKFSAMEIYNEAVRDLLSPDSTSLRLVDDPERGTVVEKLTEETLRDRDHLLELLSICEAQRQIGETSLNETSSRSHQILRLTIESAAREYAGAENSSILAASVNFVDLAGSERASQTLSAGARLKEGCHINRSLLTLGTVIRKLSKGRNAHVPYRDSKLTRVLQNSLGGNARTAIICTMSPARIHAEQSRNTLSFASCAKEVTTNAQVNLVMSDKALVKQLQRELASLEDELRILRSTSMKHETAKLLKEKELLVEQMGKEVEELTRQRDLAHSRVENLLLSVREVQMSKQSEYSSSRSIKLGEVPFIYRRTVAPRLPSFKNRFPGLAEKSEEDYFLLDGSTPKFPGPDPCKGWEDTAERTDEEFEYNCKEVRCIENVDSRKKMKENVRVSSLKPDNDEGKLAVEKAIVKETKADEFSIVPEEEKGKLTMTEVILKKTGNDELLTDPEENKVKLDMTTTKEDVVVSSPQKGNLQSNPTYTVETYQALTQKIEELQRTITFLLSLHHSGQSPCRSDASSSSDSSITRSRSCRAVLSTVPSSPSSEKAEEKLSGLKHNNRNGIISRKDSQASLTSDSWEVQNLKDSDVEDTFTALYSLPGSKKPSGNDFVRRRTFSAPDFVPGGTERKLKSRKQIDGDLAEETTDETDISIEKTNDVMELQFSWPSEFEKQQRKIIELWDVCNVPLFHRTYFIMLFKGDPSDDLYMEVELRRLNFLKNSMSCGTNTRKDGLIDTTSSSVKDLNREREMLSKLIQKKFTRKQREELFKKWGIRLNSKQRSLQLARRVWLDSKNMVHVKESAALVAKLFGFVEPNQAPEEVIGLSILPRSITRRSHSWKYAIPPLL